MTEQNSASSHSDAASQRLWKLIKSIRFCMFYTWEGSELAGRPMAAIAAQDENVLYFFADARRRKIRQIEENPRVHLTFIHPGRQKYVSIVGTAEVVNDREKIRAFWSIGSKIWWTSPDNSNIRIIKVVPLEAEFWDSPPTWLSNLRVAVGLLTKNHLYAGDRVKVFLNRHPNT